MVRTDARTLGAGAERAAERFLRRQGLTRLARNFRSRLGEIDLIMRDGRCLVFVEVRFRARSAFVRAGESVDRHKQRKLIRTAALFLRQRPQYADNVMRFDVVAIDADTAGKEKIEWIKDAFRPRNSDL